CMRDYGGFEHNFQSLRVVDELETRYADFPGLNLMFETREGILKHCSLNNARTLDELGKRFINREQPGLEAQVADFADAIAYNNHDVDDGFRAGMLTLDQLCEEPLFLSQYELVRERYPALGDRRLIYEIIRRMIDAVVTDLVHETRRNIEQANPQTIDDVRQAGRPLASMSASMLEQHLGLKRFLYRTLYSHERKLDIEARAKHTLETLFHTFMEDSHSLPVQFSSQVQGLDRRGQARVVADYIAGMTDRYAKLEYERITGKSAEGG
ncbi:MAG: deoxyguanosinetriphosphate triphosphohydrolase, partial [Pseudomonadota bacterium]